MLKPRRYLGSLRAHFGSFLSGLRKANPDISFFMNKDAYLEVFEPAYKKIIKTPKTIIQFPILLPFHIPLLDGSTITLEISGEVLSTYHFYTITVGHHVDAGILLDKPLTIPVGETRVEMNYVTSRTISAGDDFDPSDYFDALIEGLNRILTAYLIVTKDDSVHKISKEMVQFASIWRLVDVDNWGNADTGLLFLHTDVPYKKESITQDLQEKIVWYTNVINQEWNPFILSEEMALSARRFLKQGFYRETVVYAQVAVETFVNTLLIKLLMVDKKIGFGEAEKLVEEIPFMTRVKSEFHPRIGGKWDISNEEMEAGKWYRDTYELRNRIIHSGHSPLYHEAEAALVAAENFRLYMVGLIKRKKKKYPGIVKFFIADAK